MEAMRIRPCRDDERDQVLAIVNAAAEAYRGVIPADRWHEPYMRRDELDAEIAAGVAFSGCEAGDELIGVMGIQHVRDVDLIRHAYVLPARQGSGAGSALLDQLRRRVAGRAAGRHLGRRRLGDPLLPAARLRAGATRADGPAASQLLVDPRAPDRGVGGAGRSALRRLSGAAFSHRVRGQA